LEEIITPRLERWRILLTQELGEQMDLLNETLENGTSDDVKSILADMLRVCEFGARELNQTLKEF